MAVQTLSRLNRTYPAAGKDTTYVLDFVNDPDEILTSFQPYYKDATLEDTTDPDLVHDLQSKLDGAGIYTDGEVDAFVQAYLADKHGAMTAPLKSAAERFNTRYIAAVADEDKSAVDELDMFRKDVGSFIRLYDFLSQIINYQDTDLEKRSLFLRLLTRRLTGRHGAEAVDFSTVEMTHIKQTRSGEQTLNLASGEAEPMKPVTATGSGTTRDPRMVRLQEVLAKVNDLFVGEDFTPAEQQSWVEGIVTILMDDDTIVTQAAANSQKQFVESPDLSDAVTEAVLSNQVSHNKMADHFFANDHLKIELVKLLGAFMHENIRAEAG
jgi:type I restriction enzyme R subunit